MWRAHAGRAASTSRCAAPRTRALRGDAMRDAVNARQAGRGRALVGALALVLLSVSLPAAATPRLLRPQTQSQSTAVVTADASQPVQTLLTRPWSIGYPTGTREPSGLLPNVTMPPSEAAMMDD